MWLKSLEMQSGLLPRKQKSQTGRISPAPSFFDLRHQSTDLLNGARAALFTEKTVLPCHQLYPGLGSKKVREVSFGL